MKEAFAVFGGVAASLVLSASTLAAEATLSADGRTMIATGAGPTKPMQSPAKVQGLKEIVSTFNTDPDNAYNCCKYFVISAAGSPTGFRQDVAMPFTPSEDYTVKTVTVAVGYVKGTNGVTISLNADAGGLPGAVIKKGQVTGLPTLGTCCTTVSIGAKGAPVTAGTQYWVVVKTDKKTPDTFDAWNFNNIGATTFFAFKTDSGWQLSTGASGAYSVMGK